MAKTSLSDLLRSRNRIRWATLAAAVVVTLFLGQMMIGKNPKQSVASSQLLITSDTTIDLNYPDLTDRDVIIDGATVTIYSYHRMHSLIIRNNGKLTHEAAGDGTLLGREVYIEVTEGVQLSDGGQIEANGRGYAGGSDIHQDGYGPGAGYGGEIYDCHSGGGGGGHIGPGTAGSWEHLDRVPDPGSYAAGGTYAATYDGNDPNKWGSGGGWSFNSDCSNNYTVSGSAGGGFIYVKAKNFFMDAAAGIHANGADGVSSSGNRASGGAGSGGTIYIEAINLLQVEGSLNSPTALGGAAGSNNPNGAGGDGSIIGAGYKTINTSQISAKGGSGSGYGGGGGGGVVRLEGTVQTSCLITDDGNIPAYCEGKDVTIDGAEVLADTVPVWQYTSMEDRKDCTPGVVDTSSDPNCDTKRKLKSLTITNNGKLTHFQPSMVTDNTSGKDLPYDRWRKVDLELSGDLALEKGGRIDIDGKGYKGGYDAYGLSSGYHYNGFGPGGGAYRDHGYHIHTGSSGGGSHGGAGGQGESCDTDTGAWFYTGSPCVGSTYDDPNAPFDWGSGGGVASMGDYNLVDNGGAGGGRVRIKANSITINSESYTSAPSGIYARGLSGKCDDRDSSYTVCSGAGAGGSVWLEYANTFQSISNTKEVTKISADGGNSSGYRGSKGSIVLGTDVTDYVFLSANGGNGVDSREVGGNQSHGSGGGGGRILIKKSGTASSAGGVTIKKYLAPLERPAGKDDTGFNPYALQVDDVIDVRLEMAGLTPNLPTTVTDEYLTSSNPPRVCSPYKDKNDPDKGLIGYYNPDGGDTSNWVGKLTLIFTPINTTYTFYYHCKVQ